MTAVKLGGFGITEMMLLRSQLRGLFEGDAPGSFEEAADRIVRLLRDALVDAQGQPACALVRIYKTHKYGELEPSLREFASAAAAGGEAPGAGDRCLVLVATAGDEPAWNSRHGSRRHKAIPLTSEAAVASAPMVSQLIEQLGVDVAAVLRPDPLAIAGMPTQTQTVFFVPEALGSPHIPAQEEFVVPYGIRSVIGVGGILTSGDLVVAILFSKVPLTTDVAGHFKVIGLNFKLALLPWVTRPLFRA